MSTGGDRRTFRNEDLVLKVSGNIDPATWDESKYEEFFDELCGYREYQKEAIRTTLRYLLGGKYADLRALAKENFDHNTELQERYGSWAAMEQHLQLPNRKRPVTDVLIMQRFSVRAGAAELNSRAASLRCD